MQFTDKHALAVVADRYGARMARQMPVFGPIVLDIFKSFDGAFRLRYAVVQMQPNGFAAHTEAQCKNIALAVIRYVNESDEPIYFQRKHIAGTQAWIQLNVVPGNKQSLRDLDHAHAEKSRRVISFVRPDEPRRLNVQKPVQSQNVAISNISSVHMDMIKTGVFAFMQRIGATATHVGNVTKALQMYDAAVMDGAITESDDITAYDVETLKSALCQIFNITDS